MDKTTTYIVGAIVLSGLLIGGSIILTGGSGGGAVVGGGHGTGNSFGNSLSGSASNMRSVDTEKDHILGSLDAPISIVEYSDFECPFCSRLHPTLARILEEHPKEVNWVYRHFPLTSIHRNAFAAAHASECVAELGGNELFWKFADTLFENQRSLNDALYIKFGNENSIKEKDLQTCLDSKRHNKIVQEDMDNAVASGGRGTPYVIIVNKNGDTFPFSGALPYESIQQIITQAVSS